MASSADFTTAGKVLAIKDDGSVVFAPRGTSYELLLKHAGDRPPMNEPVWALISAQGRKVWTVPSGGNFLVPIMGPTKIVQGRVVFADDKEIVLKAGANVIIELPRAEAAVDLPNGAIAIGVMVNATLLPGARVEFVAKRETVIASPEVRTVGAGYGDAKP
jgi:hypothetical protein